MKTPRVSIRSFQRASVHVLIAQAEAEALRRPNTADYKIGAPPKLEEQTDWTTHAGNVFDIVIKTALAVVCLGALWLGVTGFLLIDAIRVGQ
jgi:hypothetical protein